MDEGVALATPEDFKLLYVENKSGCEKDLLTWLKSGSTPLLLGGQIGCGKTTAIEHAVQMSGVQPDITCHFDRNNLNLSSLDAWVIVFAGIARCAAVKHAKLVEMVFPQMRKVFGKTPTAWMNSASQVLLESYSSQSLAKHHLLKAALEPWLEHLPGMLRDILEKLEQAEGKRLLVFAAGVDKFEPGSAAYFNLSDVLGALATGRTLFELNATHLFTNDRWTQGLNKTMLVAADGTWIEQMLKKRLGVYANAYDHELAELAKYSGGIARQAIRLLDAFLSLQMKNTDSAARILGSIQKVNQDFFAFTRRPDEKLMRIIDKQKALETSLVFLPGDKESAMLAVFGNWIILSRPLNESQWAAIVNPVVVGEFPALPPDEPEMALLKEYAKQHGMTETGLEFKKTLVGWQEKFCDSLETPVEFNVTQMLDLISSALLSRDRDDRIIVAFEQDSNLAAVLAYLKAKSNTYEYQTWHHCVIEGGDGQTPLIKMLDAFATKAIDIYSMELRGEFTPEQLRELNVRRDAFIGKQLIWWVPKEQLRKYMEEWTQLRQLFKVFVLEDDMVKALKAEEIQADLEFMEELVETEGSAPSEYVKNLRIVLVYLKEAKREEK